jgi:hypothetical protein
MTYIPELRSALVDAASRQQAASGPGPSGRERTSARASWPRSAHGARAVLASVVLGLTGTAVGAIQVGPPLGPEPPPVHTVAKPLGAPTSVSPRP